MKMQPFFVEKASQGSEYGLANDTKRLYYVSNVDMAKTLAQQAIPIF